MKSAKDRPRLEYWDFPGENEVREEYRQYLGRLTKIFEDIYRDSSKPIHLDELTTDFVQAVKDRGWELFRVFTDGQVFRRSPAASCLNTAMTAIIFALRQGWNDPELKSLARGAFLHDIGMLFVPHEILSRPGRVEDKERAIIEAHPSVSRELTQKWFEPADVQAVVLQHHEAWDGSGYPQGLKNSAIHANAQIVGLCQSFVAMATQRDYRNSMVGYLGMKQLLALRGKRYSEPLVMTFIQVFGLYPPGSVVLLSDGSIARVLTPGEESTLRPRVQILINSEGEEFREDNGPVLDLDQARKVLIIRAVNLMDLEAPEE